MRQLTGSVTVNRDVKGIREVCQLTERYDGYEG